MNGKWADMLNRVFKLVASLTIAAVVVWRGDFGAGQNPNILTAAMSVVFALTVMVTGLVLTFEGEEH